MVLPRVRTVVGQSCGLSQDTPPSLCFYPDLSLTSPGFPVSTPSPATRDPSQLPQPPLHKLIINVHSQLPPSLSFLMLTFWERNCFGPSHLIKWRIQLLSYWPACRGAPLRSVACLGLGKRWTGGRERRMHFPPWTFGWASSVKPRRKCPEASPASRPFLPLYHMLRRLLMLKKASGAFSLLGPAPSVPSPYRLFWLFLCLVSVALVWWSEGLGVKDETWPVRLKRRCLLCSFPPSSSALISEPRFSHLLQVVLKASIFLGYWRGLGEI